MSTGETENRDFKYIMQDTYQIYVGAKYTYEELLADSEVPFKVKALINHYIKPELEGATPTIESHFYYMTTEGFTYQTFLQLKTKVRYSVIDTKKNRYTTKSAKLQDFVLLTPAEKEKSGVIIQEISLSKLALMGI